jgi:uncharacterized membrane protein
VPLLSIGFAFLLAVLTVLQLIYFVHSVSRSVTIDEEIAEISGQLEHRISEIVRDGKEETSDPKAPDSYPGDVLCKNSGYVSHIGEEALFALAVESDISIRIQQKLGGFILRDQPIAKLSIAPDKIEKCDIAALISAQVFIRASRSDVTDIGYSINLLVEIALRALSPGVNDTFTAIASLDRLTAALAPAVRFGLRTRNLTDDQGMLRLEIPGYSLEDLLNSVFHPTRQASADNLFMMIHIADALGRLHGLGNENARNLICEHGKLLLKTSKAATLLQEDVETLRQRLAFLDE